jgi:hypothetical protein
VWYVAVPTWNGGCTDGYIEPLGHAARKLVCPSPRRSTSTLMHARCSRLCNALICEKDGACAAATKKDGTGTCTRSHTAAARRAWRPKRQQELRKATGSTASRTSSSRPAHEHHPGRKRHELSARSARCTHTPPSHRSGLWSSSGVAEERSRTQRLMLCLSRDAACYRPERDVGPWAPFSGLEAYNLDYPAFRER